MIKILIVEDELPISNLLKLSLNKNGYFCDCALNGSHAVELIDSVPYDLILLDIMLPEINGLELFEYIKPLGIPVIFITARTSLEDRVKGLRMGAEDYISKPFEIAELLARISVVLRRYNKTDTQLHICGLEINTQSMQVTRGQIPVPLTRKEYELLLLFARNPNTALYRETIYERVWGGEFEYGSKTVDLHVQRLRKKAGLYRELLSVNKVGYRLEVLT